MKSKKDIPVFTRIYGDFSEPEMMALYHDLLEANRAMRNVNDAASAEYANNNPAAQRITKCLLKAIRTQDPAFIENLLACFGLHNGGDFETQFSNRHHLPSKLKRDTLIAYGMARGVTGEEPSLYELRAYIAWERCKAKLTSGKYPSVTDIKAELDRIETKQAMEKIIGEENLSIKPSKAGRPRHGSDPLRESLDRLKLTVK